jgi:hypothetical protein
MKPGLQWAVSAILGLAGGVIGSTLTGQPKREPLPPAPMHESAQKNVADALYAHSFVLLDSKNRRCGRFGISDDDKPQFWFSDTESGAYVVMVTSGDNVGAEFGSKKSKIEIDSDGPMLKLVHDKHSRLVLGKTETVTISSGVEQSTPPSSIILFDEVGKVVWEKN